MAGSVDMENLLFSFKRKFENLYLPSVYNIKSIALISFLKNEPALIKGLLKDDCLYFFQLGP